MSRHHLSRRSGLRLKPEEWPAGNQSAEEGKNRLWLVRQEDQILQAPGRSLPGATANVTPPRTLTPVRGGGSAKVHESKTRLQSYKCVVSRRVSPCAQSENAVKKLCVKGG